MSRALKETSQFKTDKKRIKRSGRYDWEKMRAVVKELMNDRALDEKRGRNFPWHCETVFSFVTARNWPLTVNREAAGRGG